MDNDIREALNYWRHINSGAEGNLYARFFCEQFPSSRRVEVQIGLKNLDGTKMLPHATRHYALLPSHVEIWETGI